MEYLNVLKELPGNFMKCGIAGWCLEVMFTSVESVLARDWRLMGRTSLLMFPIYGCGAFLSPALKLIDFWIGDQKVSLPEQLIRHGMIDMVLIFTAEYISGALAEGERNVSLGLQRKLRQCQRSDPSGFCASVVCHRIVV